MRQEWKPIARRRSQQASSIFATIAWFNGTDPGASRVKPDAGKGLPHREWGLAVRQRCQLAPLEHAPLPAKGCELQWDTTGFTVKCPDPGCVDSDPENMD
jgi:hypothetical protein